jgi:hypothetical protein
MMKSSLTITALVIAGLAGSPFVASAKTYKQTRHHTSTSAGSSTTTGANMKSSTGANASMHGNMSNQGSTSTGATKNPAPGTKY